MKPTTIATATALQNAKTNNVSTWNQGKSSAERSERPEDASNRIFDGFARVEPAYAGPKLTRSSPIFAMGSCFAREIEFALRRRGCNVISVDDRIDRPEFHDAKGQIRTGFFHRFTPFAILQEFQQAFGELDGWSEKTLLLEQGSDVIDLNYWDVPGSDLSLEATLTRRRIARELVRKAAEAQVVVLTLGLIESWFHKPTGLHANKVPAQIIARRQDEFELHLVSYQETLDCLEEIRALLMRSRETPFEMVVTVSPVPLSKTFTSDDVVIANMNSKSTLRAAATEFCRRRSDVHYFPSYEMVLYSHPRIAWRPDRIHVEPAMVRHIVNSFTAAYYQEGEVGVAPSSQGFIQLTLDGGLTDRAVEINVSLMNELRKISDMLEVACAD